MKTEIELLRELREAIEEDDNEKVHGIFDELVIKRLQKYDPEYVQKLVKMVEGIAFWYA